MYNILNKDYAVFDLKRASFKRILMGKNIFMGEICAHGGGGSTLFLLQAAMIFDDGEQRFKFNN